MRNVKVEDKWNNLFFSISTWIDFASIYFDLHLVDVWFDEISSYISVDPVAALILSIGSSKFNLLSYEIEIDLVFRFVSIFDLTFLNRF